MKTTVVGVCLVLGLSLVSCASMYSGTADLSTPVDASVGFTSLELRYESAPFIRLGEGWKKWPQESGGIVVQGTTNRTSITASIILTT